MAFNLSRSNPCYVVLAFWLFQLALLTHPTTASPLHDPTYNSILIPRAAKFILNNSTGELQAFSPVNRQLIPQGPASDGGGKGFDAPAILWLGYTFFIGLPMMLAGIRGWRLTTGVGIGLAASVLSWAAVCNSVGPAGISDLAIQLIVFGFCVFGFIIGIFEIGKQTGIALLGACGGLAFGIRLVILKSGLLLSSSDDYATNWVIVAVLGVINGVMMIWKKTQRIGLLFACASIGTFLVFLGVDLVLNRQSGMSRGLRFLFDRNSSHIVDIIGNGYRPPISTQILLGVSLALAPAFAYGQHRVFPQPFTRSSSRLHRDPTLGEIDLSSDTEVEKPPPNSEKKRQSQWWF